MGLRKCPILRKLSTGPRCAQAPQLSRLRVASRPIRAFSAYCKSSTMLGFGPLTGSLDCPLLALGARLIISQRPDFGTSDPIT